MRSIKTDGNRDGATLGKHREAVCRRRIPTVRYITSPGTAVSLMQLFPNSGIAPSWSWAATKPAPTVFQPVLSGVCGSNGVKLWISGVVEKQRPRYGRRESTFGPISIQSIDMSSDTSLMIPPMQPERDAAAAHCSRRSGRSCPPSGCLGRSRSDCYNMAMRDSSSSSESPRPGTGAFFRSLRRVRNPSTSDPRTSSRLLDLGARSTNLRPPFDCRLPTRTYLTYPSPGTGLLLRPRQLWRSAGRGVLLAGRRAGCRL